MPQRTLAARGSCYELSWQRFLLRDFKPEIQKALVSYKTINGKLDVGAVAVGIVDELDSLPGIFVTLSRSVLV